MNMIEDHFGLEALGMFEHALHQFRALQIMTVAGPVFDFGRRHQLSALLNAGDDGRFQIGACCVNCSRVACGTGAQNQQAEMAGIGHELFSPSNRIQY